MAVQDAIARRWRMLGHPVKFIPGTDHAGIATQSVVERMLYAKYSKTRHDLGRVAFTNNVWRWKEEHGSRILAQIKTLGASLDWESLYFTMDEQRSSVVDKAFVRLFDEGLIYRSDRIVNWCPHLQTAISDMEVEYRNVIKPTKIKIPRCKKPVMVGEIVQVAYRLVTADGASLENNDELLISTTRVETILGDVAVAVHSSDSRYVEYYGMYVKNPLTGAILPIIVDDELVDPSFGTGVVKITPAHDRFDFEAGQRHSLQSVNILNSNGTINSVGRQLGVENMDLFDAREIIKAKLESDGNFRGTKPNPMSVALCSRSGDIIEPMLCPQWYLKCESMAQELLKRTLQKEIEIKPAKFLPQWNRWMEGTHKQDWCISRQLWWGHQVPLYKVVAENLPETWVAASTEHAAMKKAQLKMTSMGYSDIPFKLERDPDVLDTWFSSALLPLSATSANDGDIFNIPDGYPMECIESGYDILFFWIARMGMLCTYLTGTVPFKQVLLHGLVRDAQGRKMSKSLGNVLDPLHIINGVSLESLEYETTSSNLPPKELQKSLQELRKSYKNGISGQGADALRHALVSSTHQLENIHFDMNRVINSRQLGNKIWNAVKFSLTHMDERNFVPRVQSNGDRSLLDKFIIGRLNSATQRINQAFDDFQLHEATTAFTNFFVGDFCDIYIEFCKNSLRENHGATGKVDSTLNTLWYCLDMSMRLLHPVMPFLSETLWQRLNIEQTDPSASVMIASYPQFIPDFRFDLEQKQFNDVVEVLHALRSLRSVHMIPPGMRVSAWVELENGKDCNLGKSLKEYQSTLGNMIKSDGDLEIATRTLCAYDDSDDTFTRLLSPGNVRVGIRVPKSVDANLKANHIVQLNKKLASVKYSIEKLEQEMLFNDVAQIAPKVHQGRLQRQADLQRQHRDLADNIQKLK